MVSDVWRDVRPVDAPRDLLAVHLTGHLPGGATPHRQCLVSLREGAVDGFSAISSEVAILADDPPARDVALIHRGRAQQDGTEQDDCFHLGFRAAKHRPRGPDATDARRERRQLERYGVGLVNDIPDTRLTNLRRGPGDPPAAGTRAGRHAACCSSGLRIFASKWTVDTREESAAPSPLSNWCATAPA